MLLFDSNLVGKLSVPGQVIATVIATYRWDRTGLADSFTGWWFGTFFIFPYIGNNHPNWLSYFSEGFKPPIRFSDPFTMSSKRRLGGARSTAPRAPSSGQNCVIQPPGLRKRRTGTGEDWSRNLWVTELLNHLPYNVIYDIWYMIYIV